MGAKQVRAARLRELAHTREYRDTQPASERGGGPLFIKPARPGHLNVPIISRPLERRRRVAGPKLRPPPRPAARTTQPDSTKLTAARPLRRHPNATQTKPTVLDQEYETSVADQFVSVDNDALFRCQVAPQMRDLLQVTGWLEDGHQLIAGAAAGAQTGLGALAGLFGQQPAAGRRPARRRGQEPGRLAMLPDGQLYLARVQLRDANKSYRCQVRNLLNGRASSSAISGRLFVTGEFSVRGQRLGGGARLKGQGGGAGPCAPSDALPSRRSPLRLGGGRAERAGRLINGLISSKPVPVGARRPAETSGHLAGARPSHGEAPATSQQIAALSRKLDQIQPSASGPLKSAPPAGRTFEF